MLTGLGFVIVGILVMFYPQILIWMLSSILILFGLGIMAASWQFRRLRRQSQ